STDMDIRGPGDATVLWGNADAHQRVLSIGASAHVRIWNLTIAHGWATQGGGIYNTFGDLTLTDCGISGNFASERGGIWGYGGALKIVRSIVGQNAAIAQDTDRDASGGGVFSWGTRTTVVDSSFYLNGAYYGGAIYERDADVTVAGTTFSRNNALTMGGAI